jgi:prephenate dehydrogenase
MTTASRSTRAGVWARRDARFSVTVVGCGLIGGSIALALRRRWPHVHITGIDRPSVLGEARARGMLDDEVPRRRWLQHVANADDDLIVLALPVDAILERLPQLANALRQRASERRPLVLDVGSVKAPIVELATRHGCHRFIGGHPMAGSERSGAEHASADMFDGRRFALCPPARASAADRSAARALVLGLGAEPLELDAALHDRCVAMVSHTPHLVALALMDAANRMHTALPRQASARDLPWRLAAGSWRDATRVATADATLWQSIVTANHAAIAEALDLLLDTLENVRDSLRAGGHDLLCGGEGGLEAETLARVRRRIDRYLP